MDSSERRKAGRLEARKGHFGRLRRGELRLGFWRGLRDEARFLRRFFAGFNGCAELLAAKRGRGFGMRRLQGKGAVTGGGGTGVSRKGAEDAKALRRKGKNRMTRRSFLSSTALLSPRLITAQTAPALEPWKPGTLYIRHLAYGPENGSRLISCATCARRNARSSTIFI